MLKALRVVMIIYGALLILMALTDIIAPGVAEEGMGSSENLSGYALWITLAMGGCFIAAGIWIIIAGINPQQNANLVKFAITLPALLLVMDIYAIIKGFVNVSQLLPLMIFDAIFLILLLIFYPWKAKQSS